MKYLTGIIIFVVIFLTAALAKAYAADKEAGGAAVLSSLTSEQIIDPRVTRLTAFLQFYGSPLAGDAAHFVAEADRYQLDWKLVAAIAGVESTFGKRVPYRSYNGWGWGIPTGALSGLGFTSWQEGITAVTRGLRINYVDKGAESIEQIGRIYAASPRWASSVRFFIRKIEEFAPAKLEYLALAL